VCIGGVFFEAVGELPRFGLGDVEQFADFGQLFSEARPGIPGAYGQYKCAGGRRVVEIVFEELTVLGDKLVGTFYKNDPSLGEEGQGAELVEHVGSLYLGGVGAEKSGGPLGQREKRIEELFTLSEDEGIVFAGDYINGFLFLRCLCSSGHCSGINASCDTTLICRFWHRSFFCV